MSDSPEYELRWRGRQSGPYPVSELNRMLDDHEIGMGHEILYEDEWITLEEFFAALQKVAVTANQRQKQSVATMPLAPAGSAPQREQGSSLRIKVAAAPAAAAVAIKSRPRNRLLFAFLALFAGYVGAHNFYARQWLTGLLQLLLSVATTLMGFGIIAAWLWAMVEALIVRKDGHGLEMI
jgi:TM2 domain-containing membrane protein YozV